MAILTDSNVEFSVMHFEIEGYEGEIDEFGIIDMEVPCACGTTAIMCMSAEHLEQVVRQAKMFRDRRIAFRAKTRAK